MAARWTWSKPATSTLQASRAIATWWQAEVAKAFGGQPTHPVMQALMPCAPQFGIEQRHLEAVIEGCRMDLEQTRYLDFPGLSRYCHLVAGIVGEVAARIFGQTQEATTRYAHTLGLAFQLTNIIRDVGEDGRLAGRAAPRRPRGGRRHAAHR